jgi:2',3'-cyclic-nucleotide 2'-phosphodiesterase (5'-nucleotidase family)
MTMSAKNILLGTLLLAMGCGGSAALSEPGTPTPSGPPQREVGPAPTDVLVVVEAPVSFTVLEGSVEDDPEVEALVAPFRNRMGKEIQEQIGEATGMLTEAVPEGTLGNFATDAMLWAANRELDEPVHLALTNNGGLRIPIGPGPITIGQMYELMPFENMLSVLTLTGSQVKDLCDELALRRGAPISGFSFHITPEGEGWVASTILIAQEPLDPARQYLLVTNDYMANGGDSYSSLLNPVARRDLPVLVRDAFIDFVRHKRVIEPELEGRITGGIGR